MGYQLNTQRALALRDIKDSIERLKIFKEVSFTTLSPEEVMDFPVAFIVGGGGPRTPQDIQNVHFDHRTDILVYMMWKQKIAGMLAIELEENVIQKVLDQLDTDGQIIKYSHGYDFFVSAIETDMGSLASTGMPVALGVITITALMPAGDALP